MTITRRILVVLKMAATVRGVVFACRISALIVGMGIVMGSVLSSAAECRASPQMLEETQRPKELNPLCRTNILKCLPQVNKQEYRIIDFAITKRGGYYLAFRDKQSPQFLLATDSNGGCRGSRPLPGKTSAISARRSGGLFADTYSKVGEQVRQQFIEYGTGLSQAATWQTETPVGRYVFVGDVLYGVDRNRAIVRLRTAGERLEADPGFSPAIVLGPSRVYYLAAVGDSGLYVIEEGSHRVFRIDVNTSQIMSFVLEAPELDAVLEKLPAKARPRTRERGKPYALSILGVAASPAGDLYVALNGFKIDAGPTVVKFDSSGTRSGTFVLRPAAELEAITPASKRICHVDGKLFLAAGNGVVLTYEVD